MILLDKVVLGLSGGVDSSVSAALLKEQGFEVVGCVLKVWREDQDTAFIEQKKDALRIADFLGLELIELDISEQFKKEVIDYFVSEYDSGRTPNPCVVCNRTIKFKYLVDLAKKIGAKYIATGHYAKVEHDKKTDRYLLKRSQANSKDQTYFLYSLSQQVLSKTLMPLANYNKTQVREIASRLSIPVADKPDSQEICFLPDKDYVNFIKRYADINPKGGNFVDIDGNVIGRHSGIINYTIGQRKGLGVAFGRPMFVIDIDAKSNTVTLGEAGSDLKNELTVRDANFISIERLDGPMRVTAKIRQGFKDAPATIEPKKDGLVRLTFDNPVRAITRGQSAVFYNDDIVVGGGIII